MSSDSSGGDGPGRALSTACPSSVTNHRSSRGQCGGWWSSTPTRLPQPLRRGTGTSSPALATVVCCFLVTWTRQAEGSRAARGVMANTSSLLDSLLSEKNYNRQFRPGFGGPPTEIFTDILIRSFGPVSENEMMFSMDCYFRQTWYDRRLSFHGDIKVLSVSWQFLELVWKPDTYFFNGKSSYLHKVTVPNKFVRLFHDGRLMYSMRLTIKASCPMHLRKYPLDTQACPLEIGSFAYSSKEVVFRWKGPEPVVISPDVTLSQYEFLSVTATNLSTYGPGGEVRSSLMTRFILSRRRGYFILQIYAPCSMIVGASWVAFWINRSDAAGRVAVGATTVLTLVTMGFGGRASLPKVDYATALDWFVIMCFTFVFTALVEYACVNYIERFLINRERKRLEALAQKEERRELAKELTEPGHEETVLDDGTSGSENVRLRLENADEDTVAAVLADAAEDASSRQGRLRAGVPTLGLARFGFRWWGPKQRLGDSHPDTAYARCSRGGVAGTPASSREQRLTPSEVAGEMDAWARIIFPVTFTALKVMYWTLFLYFVDDEIPEDPPPQN
ncbi:gamma-aminobutyric acid receptor subunit alpha-6 isoform X1 [Rhipicephalus microplus]|uniref:gamma-aminobutyric acid receptor subunit alpha-6 isoform X1 n=2 Tax=Rhipicephalus microplus TaxID=6941 RepID=UPI003F6AE7D5